MENWEQKRKKKRKKEKALKEFSKLKSREIKKG